MTRLYIIDRIERSTAVLSDERGVSFDCPLSLLPKGAREGMALRRTDGRFVLDEDSTVKRRALMAARLNRLLWKRRGRGQK